MYITNRDALICDVGYCYEYRSSVFSKMRNKIRTIIIIFLIASVLSQRVKRHLVFTKGSRFFLRLNVRENLFTYTTIFAHAAGFRMNWDLPDKVLHHNHPKKLRRRDIHKGIEELLNRHNFNGSSCVSKFVCESSEILENSKDFILQLYRILFKPKEDQGEIDNCRKVTQDCPFSLLQFAT